MHFPEHYAADAAFFFQPHPAALPVYESLLAMLESTTPEASVRIQKTQISFYGRHLFAAVSLRRRRTWPKDCLVLTLGLPFQPASPRFAETVEPYPGRWTCHLPLCASEQLDEEVRGWIRQAWDFSETK